MSCSIARTLDIVGERWTLLIVRDAFSGVRRFDDFLVRLPIARNVLTDRLNTLVEHGILRRKRYQEHPARYEYRLTSRGTDLYPVLVALMQWGDSNLEPAGAPSTRVVHGECGADVGVSVTCRACGKAVSIKDSLGVSVASSGDPRADGRE